MHEFGLLEDAVLAALAPLRDIGLKTLEAWAGQLDVDGLEDITYQYPCIYVVTGSLTNEKINRSDKMVMELNLIAGDRNLRGSVAAARGDTGSPGVYGLLSGARELLHRQRMLPNWTPLSLSREEPIVYEPSADICLYSARYELKTMV